MTSLAERRERTARRDRQRRIDAILATAHLDEYAEMLARARDQHAPAPRHLRAVEGGKH